MCALRFKISEEIPVISLEWFAAPPQTSRFRSQKLDLLY